MNTHALAESQDRLQGLREQYSRESDPREKDRIAEHIGEQWRHHAELLGIYRPPSLAARLLLIAVIVLVAATPILVMVGNANDRAGQAESKAVSVRDFAKANRRVIERDQREIGILTCKLVSNARHERDASRHQLEQLLKKTGGAPIFHGISNAELQQNIGEQYHRAVQGLDPASC